jgi:integrase
MYSKNRKNPSVFSMLGENLYLKGVILMRSLYQQQKYAINQMETFGHSRHLDKKDPNINTEDNIYSIKGAESHKDLAKNFSNFMKENYPEVRAMVDVKAKHITAFFDAHAGAWSQKTIDSYYGKFQKIENACRRFLSKDISYMDGVEKPRSEKEKVRVRAMEQADFDRISSKLCEKETPTGWMALHISARCGLRVNEAACLKGARINLTKHVIEIREGAKGGKPRDVPIRPQDMQFFANLKNRFGDGYLFSHPDGTHYRADSLNKPIRDAIHELGLNDKYDRTTIHSVRKMWAGERLREEISRLGGGTDKKTILKAWGRVEKELGHEDMFRRDLYNTYVRHAVKF